MTACRSPLHYCSPADIRYGNNMKVTLLGTNGWYDTDTGNTTCVLVDTEKCYLVLDAGNGIYKLDRYITEEKPIYLFLSHPHLDHVAGFHSFNKFRFPQGMTIIGQPGTRAVLGRIIDLPFTVPFSALPMKVIVEERSEGTHNTPVRMECRYLVHSTPCFGYRFEIDGKALTFCTDTGACENLVRLARDADLLITECAFRPGEKNDAWPHLNPEQAAQMAVQSHARRLALVHFDADRYRSLAAREEAVANARRDFKEIIVGYDGLQIIV